MKIEVGQAVPKSEREATANEILIKPRNFANFIDAYLAFTENQESTRRIHTWVAISIIAAALERKARLNMGHFLIFPNLYTFIIGESGTVRKSTSTGIGVSLLRDIETQGIPGVKIMSDRMTASALIQQLHRSISEYNLGNVLERQSAVYCYASELNVFLREVYGSISELLTTFYDCVPYDSKKPWVYETIKDGELKIYGPCLNILGASTPAWLSKSIPANEMEGGFSSRVLFVVERESPKRLVAWPEEQKDAPAIREKLVEDLRQIHSLRGWFRKTPEAHTFYTDWYRRHKQNKSKFQDPRFVGYYGRKPIMVLKIAMILAVAEGNELCFDARHLQSAIALLDDLEPAMTDAFGGVGTNRFAQGVHKIRELFVHKPALLHRDILKALWLDFNGKEITEIMRDLISMGEVKQQLIASTGGERDIVYTYLRKTSSDGEASIRAQ